MKGTLWLRRLVVLGTAMLWQSLSMAQAPVAASKAPVRSALDKATLEQYVRHLYGAFDPRIQFRVFDPKPSSMPGFQEVTVFASNGKASQEESFLVSADGRKVIRGTVFDINENPFKAELAKIDTAGQPFFGKADAPVTLVMYSDFQCSFCKEEAKVVRANIQGSYANQVKVYFKDFPLEQIHPWARDAAIAGRCVAQQRPEAFWTYHDWVFEHQSELKPEDLKVKVLEFAKGQKLDEVALGQCLDQKATNKDVDKSIAEATSLSVNSTPTMFLNGRKVVGQVGWDQLKSLIDHEIEYAKNQASADKCCEIQVTSPVQ